MCQYKYSLFKLINFPVLASFETTINFTLQQKEYDRMLIKYCFFSEDFKIYILDSALRPSPYVLTYTDQSPAHLVELRKNTILNEQPVYNSRVVVKILEALAQLN